MISKIYTEDWFGRTNGGYTFDESEMHHGIVKVDNHKYSSFLYNEDKAERICSDPEYLKKEMVDMIHAVGLTRLKLQEKIKDMLVSGGYISDPFVLVRFRSYKIFFLGANGGKAINITNERCTFLEALALSGDMSVYTNRDKIMVVREIDGKMVSRYLDPRSSKVYDDPFFMLQQNDFIITRNTGYRTFQQSYSQFGTVLSVVSSIMSLTSTYFIIRTYMNSNK